jgi:hypothetical protein
MQPIAKLSHYGGSQLRQCDPTELWCNVQPQVLAVHVNRTPLQSGIARRFQPHLAGFTHGDGRTLGNVCTIMDLDCRFGSVRFGIFPALELLVTAVTVLIPVVEDE